MITKELISYLERCHELGVKKEQTMSALLSAGWKLSHIQEGFKILEARQIPMKKPKVVFPTMHVSLSLLFLLVLGTSSAVLFSNSSSSNQIASQNLQANIIAIPSPEEQEAAKVQEQINKVSRVTDALRAYKDISGVYPISLEALLKTGEAVFASSSKNSSSIAEHDRSYLLGLYGEKPLYEGDFTDIFTQSEFVYNSTGDDYVLSYMLRWNTPQTPLIESQFLNGWNVANQETLSAREDNEYDPQ